MEEAHLEEFPTSSCTTETRTCNSGSWSPSDFTNTYVFEDCTVTPVNCTTTISGKKGHASHAISIAGDGGETGTCPSSGKNYTCTISTPTTAVVTVTSNSVDVIAATCDSSQTHNF